MTGNRNDREKRPGSYVEIVLGNAPTDRQRADLAILMQRHGVDEEHPVLGVLAEMVLYRDQMQEILKQMQGVARQCDETGAAMYEAAVSLDKTARMCTAKSKETFETGTRRLVHLLNGFQSAALSEVDKIATGVREGVERHGSDLADVKTMVSRRRELGWIGVAAIGLLAAGTGLAVGMSWNDARARSSCVVKAVQVSQTGQRYALCE